MRVNEKFKAGIIFCGGCNPYFDREKLFKQVAAEFSDICDFIPYDEGSVYDIIVLINGCQSECLMEADYNGKLIVINDRNYTNFVEEINTALDQIKK